MKAKFNYGWVNVCCCMLLSAASIGMISHSRTLFMEPLCGSLGFSSYTYAFGQTFITAASMISAPLWGKLFSKYPLRPLLLTGIFSQSVALFALSAVSSPALFYFLNFCTGFFTGATYSFPIVVLLSSWFPDRYGLASSIAYAGSSLFAMFFSPFINYIINAAGWRGAYRLIALLFLLLTLPPSAFLIREKPAPCRSASLHTDQPVESFSTSDTHFPVLLFGLTAVLYFMIGLTNKGIQQYLVPHFTLNGYSSRDAVFLYSLSMGFVFLGKIISGIIYDRYGSRAGSFYLLFSLALSIAVLIPSPFPLLTAVFPLLYGLSNAIYSVFPAHAARFLFGSQKQTTFFGYLKFFFSLGTAAGAPLTTFVYEQTHSYHSAWLLYFAITLLCILNLIYIMKIKKF